VSDPNIIKLLAPEQIPQPRVNEGPDVYKYTKDMYDFLRRLFQNLALILVDVGSTGPLIVYNEWIKFTQTATKFDVDTRDWRGRIIRVQILTIDNNVTDANDNQWAAPTDLNPRVFKAGSTYDSSGASGDIDLLQVIGAGANDATLSLDEDTGKLQMRCDGFTAEWQIEILVEGFKVRDEPDRTV
jgi:hypothetical protein